MNQHVNGVIFKDHITERVEPKPKPKPQRKPLGLALVPDELSSVSALDGVPTDELASPATVQHVLEALDAAVAIRSELDRPLRVRIGRLESTGSELNAELAASRAERAELKASVASLKTTVAALRTMAKRDAEKRKAEAKAATEAKLARVLARVDARRAEQKATP
jgi:hypothetical protein